MSCMAKQFFDTLPIKPKLIPCDRYIAGMGGETLKPVGKCFVQLQIGKRVFRDRVVVIKNLRHKYILGKDYRDHTGLVPGTQPQVNIILP